MRIGKPGISSFDKFATGHAIRTELRAMGAEEEQVQSMIDKINALGMDYKNFESSKVLFIAATINKQPKVFINNKLQRIVDDINIAPEDFIKIATERYNVDIEQVLQ